MFIIYFWIFIISTVIVVCFMKFKYNEYYSTRIRFNSVEEEKNYVIDALRSFRDGEINFEELDNRVCEVNLEKDIKLHILVESILDNPFIEVNASPEDFEYLTRVIDFIRSGEKYPSDGGCWCRGCLVNLIIRFFTLGFCSYRKYQIFLKVKKIRSEEYWPFKSEQHFLQAMKKLQDQ